jgi:hypothetical protein
MSKGVQAGDINAVNCVILDRSGLGHGSKWRWSPGRTRMGALAWLSREPVDRYPKQQEERITV